VRKKIYSPILYTAEKRMDPLMFIFLFLLFMFR